MICRILALRLKVGHPFLRMFLESERKYNFQMFFIYSVAIISPTHTKKTLNPNLEEDVILRPIALNSSIAIIIFLQRTSGIVSF